MPNILGLDKIKYPPGTKMRAKNKHSTTITITKVSSWHGYDTVVWDDTGVHINIHPQYHIKYDNVDIHGVSSEDSLEDGFEIITESDL